MSSSPSQAPAQAPAKPPKQIINPKTTPIPTLADPVARTYTHIHTILILAFYRLRFSFLVADPVAELLRNLAPLAVAQIAYVVLCLPPTTGSGGQVGDSTKSGKNDIKRKDPRKEVNRAQVDVSSRVTTALLSVPLSLLPSTIIFTIILVLFGAPLTTHHTHTLLAGAHISLLAAFPLFYTHGVKRASWWEIAAFMLPFDEVWGGAVGTVVGAWMGALPIPLDWDRDWQKWPVTIVTGAYVGWAMGRIMGTWALRGRRINFDP